MTSTSPAPAPAPRPGTTGRTTAVVTGGTVGIGREFAEQLAARGLDLVLVARDEARLAQAADELARRHGVHVETLAADLADRADVDRVAARLADPARPVGWLVNNAGFGLKERFLDADVEAEQAMLDVLVTAVLRLTHAALPGMVERGGGTVVNVSSVAAFLPRGTYGAAKAWVNRFGVWAAQEYGPHGVRVTTVCPGFVRTEFHGRMGVERGSAPRALWLQPEVVVREALAAVEANRALVVPTRRYRALVGLARAVPTPVLLRFQRLGR
ncbi:SDR family oxidoreductase [Nocardioides sp. ChNu-153]|uniref:SDR family NAD(P)-dependent oxidoreductase n=1 Tax=unclassified Nocardioides TaxID=2615069 RepID=UPI002404CE46|nr:MULTISPECIES: SDR family oxidoreductase [unclassified Nocardioides]MDF9717436.1 SDR family oxidoreductase [Nocardioides sp. ChNu-99]MDN7120858.1 SDR family oxidoreductase [Nocardioides sp. ChNu-153]